MMMMVMVLVMTAGIWTQADHHAGVAARPAHLRVGRRTGARRTGTTPPRYLSFHPFHQISMKQLAINQWCYLLIGRRNHIG